MEDTKQQKITELLNSDKTPEHISAILQKEYGVSVTTETIRKAQHNRRLHREPFWEER